MHHLMRPGSLFAGFKDGWVRVGDEVPGMRINQKKLFLNAQSDGRLGDVVGHRRLRGLIKRGAL